MAYAANGPAPLARGDRGSRLVRRLLLLTILISGVVVIEPAPTDLLAALFIPIGLFLGRPAVHRRLVLPGLALTLFLITNFVSVVAAADPTATLRFLAITLYLVGFSFVLVLYLTRHGASMAEDVLRAYALGLGGSALVGTIIFTSYPPLFELVAPRLRLGAFFKDANVFGAAVIPAFAYAAVALTKTESKKGVWLIIAASCLAGSVFSYSRGSWVCALVTTAALVGLRLLGARGNASVRTLTGFLVGMLILSPLVWQLLQTDSVREMMEIRLRYQNYDDNRFATQLDAIVAAAEYPLGIGPGLSESTFSRATHSLYVRALIENGIVGFLAMVALLFCSLARASWGALTSPDPQARAVLAVVAASLWGLTAESLVIDSVHWRHFWLFIALAWTPGHLRWPRGSTED